MEFGSLPLLLFQSSSALGVSPAGVIMYMLSTAGVIDLAGRRDEIFAHHAHHRAQLHAKNSSIEHCTALIAQCVCFIHPSMTAPSLAIFKSASSGIPCVVK